MSGFAAIETSAKSLLDGDTAKARQIILQEYPFERSVSQKRGYTDKEKMRQFAKDGFIDRYSGQKLINPGLLKVLSCYMPEEFPYHAHWKMSDCHKAYWEYAPTVDHIIPAAAGGADTEENRATTSMLHNAVKSSWSLGQLNWKLFEPGDFGKYDGLTALFVRLTEKDPDLLKDSYIRRWYKLSKEYV